jgi:hypothetical protein
MVLLGPIEVNVAHPHASNASSIIERAIYADVDVTDVSSDGMKSMAIKLCMNRANCMLALFIT